MDEGLSATVRCGEDQGGSLVGTYYIGVINTSPQAQAQDYRLYFDWHAGP
jgi:energy-converting hydrogenase Eha subunit B